MGHATLNSNRTFVQPSNNQNDSEVNTKAWSKQPQSTAQQVNIHHHDPQKGSQDECIPRLSTNCSATILNPRPGQNNHKATRTFGATSSSWFRTKSALASCIQSSRFVSKEYVATRLAQRKPHPVDFTNIDQTRQQKQSYWMVVILVNLSVEEIRASLRAVAAENMGSTWRMCSKINLETCLMCPAQTSSGGRLTVSLRLGGISSCTFK